MSFAKNLALSAALGSVLVASPLMVNTSGAATLTIDGGVTGTNLGAAFNPTNAASMLLDGIGVGTAITIFDWNTVPGAGVGLHVSPLVATITFQYKGYEAGYTNVAAAELTYSGTPLFTNNSTAPDSIFVQSYDTTADGGLVPFLFKSLSGLTTAANGGTPTYGSSIAFAQVDANTVYAFFDDSGGNVDADFDDMVVKISVNAGTALTTPIPGALPLFASGLGLIGFVARRRKQKASSLKPV